MRARTTAIPDFGNNFTLQRRFVKLNDNHEVGDNQSDHLQPNMQRENAFSWINITLLQFDVELSDWCKFLRSILTSFADKGQKNKYSV